MTTISWDCARPLDINNLRPRRSVTLSRVLYATCNLSGPNIETWLRQDQVLAQGMSTSGQTPQTPQIRGWYSKAVYCRQTTIHVDACSNWPVSGLQHGRRILHNKIFTDILKATAACQHHSQFQLPLQQFQYPLNPLLPIQGQPKHDRPPKQYSISS